MADEATTATVEVAPEIKELGDKIAGLSLKQAVELKDYLKDAYGLEPAASGAARRAADAHALRSRRFLFGAIVLALFVARSLRRNRLGRLLIGTRDNGKAVQAYGVNLASTKLAAFAISGFIAAVAIFARQENFYWMGLFVPAFGIGLVFVPQALRDLLCALRRPSRVDPNCASR